MKLIISIVVDVNSIEEAISSYNGIDENWIIAASKLNGRDFHPSLYGEAESKSAFYSGSCPICGSPLESLSLAPLIVSCTNPTCSNNFLRGGAK